MWDFRAAAAAPVDAGRLAVALEAANIPTLVAVLYQLTGDRRWITAPYAPARGRGMDDNATGGLPRAVQDDIRRATLLAVLAWAEGTLPAVPAPRGGHLVELLSVCMGEAVPAEYEPMMADMLGFTTPRDAAASAEDAVPAGVSSRFDVVIIGAGVSGMTAAIKLRAAGVSVTVLEKSDEVGGTWWENRYPGAGVDTPSYLYSLSFFERDWSAHFGKRDEVQAYLQALADEYDLRPLIRFNTEVAAADWDGDVQRWNLTTTGGDHFGAHAIVSAVGQLNRPKIPAISGLDSFTGPLFHSAQWPADVNLTGRRVAIVGTGASAMQIVPAIVDRVAELTIYQRSPQWIAPNADYFTPVGEDVHLLMATVPFYRRWYRARLAWTFNDKVHPALQVDPDWPDATRSINATNDSHRRFFTRYLTEQLADRLDLQQAALPDYPPFGKRMLLDNGWFAAIRQPNVQLITEPVVEVTPDAVRDAVGALRGADIIVLCTGFQATRFLHPMRIRGRSGRTLEEHWGPEDATAYLGITVPDFPNLFLLLGPNTALGHGGSAITVSEMQTDYIVELINEIRAGGVGTVEVRPEIAADYTARVDKAHAGMIWTHPGMTNWYRNGAGRVVSTLPWRIVDYRTMTATPALADYLIRPG